VRTPFGFHAIKVSEIRPADKTPLKDVAVQIREKLSAEAADKAAKAKADEVRPKLAAAADFSAEARTLGLNPLDTTMARIDRPDATPKDTMEQTAFELAIGGVSPPVKTAAGWAVLKALAVLPAAVPPLAEIKDRVATAVKRERAEGIALEKAKQLAADAKAGDFAAAAKKAGATTGETAPFTLAKPVEKLPGDAMLAAFQAPLNATTEPVKTQAGVYVMKVLQRTPPDPAAFAADKDKVAKEILTQKQSQAWQSWVETARTGAKIEMGTPPSRRTS
jgi:peptidyl-prolyl cis-trans isomerase D